MWPAYPMGKHSALLLLLLLYTAAGRGSSTPSLPGKLLLQRRNTASSSTAHRSNSNIKAQLAALRGGARGKTRTTRTALSDRRADGMLKSSTSRLGRLRDALFPIYGREETGKFLALGGIQFFIIFVLTLTRDLKDTLVITSCGAEAISFLKVCPCARGGQQRAHQVANARVHVYMMGVIMLEQGRGEEALTIHTRAATFEPVRTYACIFRNIFLQT